MRRRSRCCPTTTISDELNTPAADALRWSSRAVGWLGVAYFRDPWVTLGWWPLMAAAMLVAVSVALTRIQLPAAGRVTIQVPGEGTAEPTSGRPRMRSTMA